MGEWPRAPDDHSSEGINELLAAGLKQVARPSARRQLGQLRGTIAIADDFDETPAEVLESLEDPL